MSAVPDDVRALAIEWAEARSECVEAAIGSDGYRQKLNRLSNAEDALSRAAKAARPSVPPVPDARDEMINVLKQADCLRHYSRTGDWMQSVGELQAGHFEDIAVRAFPDLQPMLDDLRAKRATEAAERQRLRAETEASR